MKLNMEIMYVPQANIYQLRDMMTDWKTASNRVSGLSYMATAAMLLCGIILKTMADDYYSLTIGGAAVFLVCAVFSRKWYYMGYMSSFIGFLLCVVRLSLFPLDNIAFTIALIVFSSLPMIFAYKCIFNYKNVFKELKKREGFPNFIANTADLYADKIYLRTEKEKGTQSCEKIQKEYVKAGYNPFKSEEELKAESFARQQNFTVKTTGEVIHEDIDADDETRRKILLSEAKKEAHEMADTYKYGLTAFGREIVFLHNDIHTSSIDDKRSLMWKWRNNIEWTMKDFGVFTVIMSFALLTSGLSIGGLLGRLAHIFVTLILFMLGTSYMRQNKPIGAIITLLTNCYVTLTLTSFLGAGFLLASYIVNPGILFGSVRFLLNYKLYVQLSNEDGFPSFIKTTADLYGDKIYIVEEQAPLVKKDPALRKVKVMDIGVNEKPKKKNDKAWNAFDYKDEEMKGEENEG